MDPNNNNHNKVFGLNQVVYKVEDYLTNKINHSSNCKEVEDCLIKLEDNQEDYLINNLSNKAGVYSTSLNNKGK